MRKRLPIVIFCSILSFVLSLSFLSCATTVHVQLTRPAELDLNGARTIAVLPFKPMYYYQDKDASIGKQIVINTFLQIFNINDKDEQMAIDTLHNQIERGLINSPFIKVVSAEAVERALQNGNINPADVYLTGGVSYYDVDDKRTDEKKLVKAATETTKAEYQIVSTWKREVTFTFRYQIVDSSTNKIISADDFRCHRISSSYDSKRSLPDAYYLIESDIKYEAGKILQELQPYAVTKSITLLEAKTKDKALKERMKAADDMANNSMLEKASAEFTKIYEESNLVEAGYNAAVLQEALGNLSLAERMMEELYLKNPDNRVAKGLEDIRYEIRQANRLKKQINAYEADGDLDDF